MHHTIGDEFTWAREGMAELLCEDGLEVREVTTDPDSSAGRAADSLYKDGLLGQNFSIPPLTRMKQCSMLVSQSGCLQLSWTRQSKTVILRRSKASTELCDDHCLAMSPSQETLLAGLTVLLTSVTTVPAAPSEVSAQGLVLPYPLVAKWTRP